MVAFSFCHTFDRNTIPHATTVKGKWNPRVTETLTSILNRLQPFSHRAEGKGVIIVEGILIFSDPQLRDLLDVKIFVDTVSSTMVDLVAIVVRCTVGAW